MDEIELHPECEVLIIGAGINGIAIFRELALNGVDVLLVDRGDIASGASSASSHMVHGGIRYLENGEFRLVRESVQERNRLLAAAPHLVHPLPTTVPLTSTFGGLITGPLKFVGLRRTGPSERGALLVKIGLVLYDIFSRAGGTVPRHRFRGRRASLREVPQLRKDIAWTATYWDASMRDPERLALEVMRDGIESSEISRVATYVEVAGRTRTGVVLREVDTGREVDMHARVVINVTGPWVDLTNKTLGDDSALMGGTRGSHIVIESAELLAACAGRELFFEFRDGRIVLVYPLGDRVLVGTSDIPHDMADPIRCTEDEITYFLDLVAWVLPDVAVTRDMIVYRFSGVRPLPRAEGKSPGQVTRDYQLVQHDDAGTLSQRFSVVGGKWTTFRALGESVSDEILCLLSRPRRTDTRRRLLPGARDLPRTPADRASWAVDVGLDQDRAETLLERYGALAVNLARVEGAEQTTTLEHAPDYTTAEIEYLVQAEGVVHIDDLLLRRTSLAFRGRVTVELLHELTELVAKASGWSRQRATDECSRAVRILRDDHGVSFSSSAPALR